MLSSALRSLREKNSNESRDMLAEIRGTNSETLLPPREKEAALKSQLYVKK